MYIYKYSNGLQGKIYMYAFTCWSIYASYTYFYCKIVQLMLIIMALGIATLRVFFCISKCRPTSLLLMAVQYSSLWMHSTVISSCLITSIQVTSVCHYKNPILSLNMCAYLSWCMLALYGKCLESLGRWNKVYMHFKVWQLLPNFSSKIDLIASLSDSVSACQFPKFLPR